MPANYLAHYPPALVAQVHHLIAHNQFAEVWLNRYPSAHEIRTDHALYDYVHGLKSTYLRHVGQIARVEFDGNLQALQRALGTHTRVSRVQGSKLKTRREIRIAAVFKDMPLAFLRMIVVHELAHFKELEHGKAFYQLCQHIEPNYAQLEFDLRAYLTYLDQAGKPIWMRLAEPLV